MGWNDFHLPRRFITGFQAVGELEDTHLWTPMYPYGETRPQPVSEAEILEERRALLREVDRRNLDEVGHPNGGIPDRVVQQAIDGRCIRRSGRDYAGPPCQDAGGGCGYG